MSKVTICKRYHFSSSHFLPKVPPEHPCANLHGHNYVVEVEVQGPINEQGFVIDFHNLDLLVKPLIKTVDHRHLNLVAGLENPSAEIIATWFLNNLDHASAITIWETEKCWARVSRYET